MVSVWNNDRFGKNFFLGEVILPLDKVVDDGVLSKPNTAWYHLQEKVFKYFITVKAFVFRKGR